MKPPTDWKPLKATAARMNWPSILKMLKGDGHGDGHGDGDGDGTVIIGSQEKNDCALTTIANVFELPYTRVHAFFKLAGRINNGRVSMSQIIKVLDALQVSYAVANPKFLQQHYLDVSTTSPPLTAAQIIAHSATWRNGARYMAVTQDHAYPIIDGVPYNTGNCRYATVKHLFKRLTDITQ